MYTGTCEPAETDEFGVPIEEAAPAPEYEDEEEKRVPKEAASKPSLVSRFKVVPLTHTSYSLASLTFGSYQFKRGRSC